MFTDHYTTRLTKPITDFRKVILNSKSVAKINNGKRKSMEYCIERRTTI